MNKPIKYKSTIIVIGHSDDNYELLLDICKRYGQTHDFNSVSFICYSEDAIYENLESRMNFFIKSLKSEGFKPINAKIEALILEIKL